MRRFDKGGDDFYDQISAFHKSDARFQSGRRTVLATRACSTAAAIPPTSRAVIVRIASEDVGNADPRALGDCARWRGQPYERHRLVRKANSRSRRPSVYCACAAKSNAVYKRIRRGAQRAVAERRFTLPVPVHIRNAPTGLAKRMGHGAAYRYDHDEPEAFAAGQTYFPDELGEQVYYEPVERGLEIRDRREARAAARPGRIGMGTGFKVLVPIALGGAAGALLRYLVSMWAHALAGTGFPYGTLLVNVAGSFAIGLLYVVIVEQPGILAHYRGPLMVGLLGAFTTFSAFSLETLHLVEGGEIGKAGLNTLLNVVLCLGACWAGLALARAHT